MRTCMLIITALGFLGCAARGNVAPGALASYRGYPVIVSFRGAYEPIAAELLAIDEQALFLSAITSAEPHPFAVPRSEVAAVRIVRRGSHATRANRILQTLVRESGSSALLGRRSGRTPGVGADGLDALFAYARYPSGPPPSLFRRIAGEVAVRPEPAVPATPPTSEALEALGEVPEPP
ncbi:MAG: hypothetical protein AAGF12_10535 [Myxococcota bacterium]